MSQKLPNPPPTYARPKPPPAPPAKRIDDAYAFVDSVLDRADVKEPFPAWHGWALREAFAAGRIAEREACAVSRDETIERLRIELRALQQRYEILLRQTANVSAMSSVAVLADKGSFEAGRFMEREECAKICEAHAESVEGVICAQIIRARGANGT